LSDLSALSGLGEWGAASRTPAIASSSRCDSFGGDRTCAG